MNNNPVAMNAPITEEERATARSLWIDVGAPVRAECPVHVDALVRAQRAKAWLSHGPDAMRDAAREARRARLSEREWSGRQAEVAAFLVAGDRTALRAGPYPRELVAATATLNQRAEAMLGMADEEWVVVENYRHHGRGADATFAVVKTGKVCMRDATDLALSIAMDNEDVAVAVAARAEWRARWPERPSGSKGWAQAAHQRAHAA